MAKKNKGQECFYCGLLMKHSLENRGVWYKKLGLKKGAHRSRKLLNYSMMTREHLIQRQHGGRNRKNNIVFAHGYCNSLRLDFSVKQQMIKMTGKVICGTHPLQELAKGQT